MALKCAGDTTDFKSLYQKYSSMDHKYSSEMQEEVHYAMNRYNALGLPLFAQDFAFRLVKLNQIDYTMWGTDFVKKVYTMVEELDDAEKTLVDTIASVRTHATNSGKQTTPVLDQRAETGQKLLKKSSKKKKV